MTATKMGLENVHRMDQLLGHPSRKINFVHVTGSNGKGSTCWKLAKSFQACGYKTGLFLSPHMTSFVERIRVHDQLITQDQVVDIVGDILALSDKHKIPITFFEISTILMFEHFARSNLDVAVVEVGLGGRLDSTNILRNPLLSIITNVSKEHTRILGSTIEEIAYEKAGILKENSPVLIGPHVPLNIVTKVANEKKAGPITQAIWNCGDTPLDFDKENTLLVEHALDILKLDRSKCVEALQSRPPCRFEVVQSERFPKRLHILDMGHNPAALTRFFETIDLRMNDIKKLLGCVNTPVDLYVVFAMSSDKDFIPCVEKLKREDVKHVFFTKAATSRAQDPVLLSQEFDSGRCTVLHSVQEAMHRANATIDSTNRNSVVLVCGSGFMMTAAKHFLKLDFPCDPDGVNYRPAQDDNNANFPIRPVPRDEECTASMSINA